MKSTLAMRNKSRCSCPYLCRQWLDKPRENGSKI